MKKLSIILVLIGLFAGYGFFADDIKLSFYEDTLLKQEKLCQNAKRDFEVQDTLTVQESNETKVNVFMNAKYNLHSCYDLELLKRQLISSGVSPEKLKFLELKAIENDGDLIEFTMPAT